MIGEYQTNQSTRDLKRIVVQNLSKSYEGKKVVDNVSFTVEPGAITGFIGANGAGKTTTLRMLLDLVHPSSGSATIGGHTYDKLTNPLSVVGASLEASNFFPNKSGLNHVKTMCYGAGVDISRADELLELVQIGSAARRSVKKYSLGMKQRLALAMALVADPHVLILDEPSNGLDPQGITWLRHLLRDLANQGKTIVVSSHLLAEMEKTIDNVVIIDRGKTVVKGVLSQLLIERQASSLEHLFLELTHSQGVSRG